MSRMTSAIFGKLASRRILQTERQAAREGAIRQWLIIKYTPIVNSGKKRVETEV